MVAIVAPLPEAVPSSSIPPLELDDIEYFTIRLPTFKGIWTIFLNAIAVNDWLAMNYPIYIVVLGLFWWHPILFTLVLWPFQSFFRAILRLFGFERAGVRVGSAAARYQSTAYGDRVPCYSTFAQIQSHAMAPPAYEEDDDENVPAYATVLGWIAGILAMRALIMGIASVDGGV